MNPEQRIVTVLPLTELWTRNGPLVAERIRLLNRPETVALLSAGKVQFIVADVGRPLRWIPPGEYTLFWQDDLRDHLVEHPDSPIDICHFSEGYAYVASEWIVEGIYPVPTVVLECHH